MNLTPELLGLGAIWFVVFLFSTTLHEAGHAFVALKLGDPTAYRGGQVTLNPIPHMRREPFGMVLAPILTFLFYGWMMGWASAPYDPRWAFRHPRKAAWMALAGPLANLALVIVAGFVIRVGLGMGLFVLPEQLGFATLVAAAPGPAAAVAMLASVTFSLNLVLFTFNLLPLPPLDGSGIVPLILPAAAARSYRAFLAQPMLSLLGIVIAWKLFGTVFYPVFGFALGWLLP